MKTILKICFVGLIFLFVFSLNAKKSYALWSAQYFDTQCYQGTTNDPCAFAGYFDQTCNIAGDICLISSFCNLKAGNQCTNAPGNSYWWTDYRNTLSGFQQCINTNSWYSTDETTVQGTYSCSQGGYRGFQFYTPPETPTPTPTPIGPTPTP